MEKSRYLQRKNGYLVFSAENNNKAVEITIKDGNIIKIFKGDSLSCLHNVTCARYTRELAVQRLSGISLECLMEIFKVLEKNSPEFELAKKLLKDHKHYELEKAKMIFEKAIINNLEIDALLEMR